MENNIIITPVLANMCIMHKAEHHCRDCHEICLA